VQAIAAQIAAMTEWGKPDGERFRYLALMKQPTLIVAGNHVLLLSPSTRFTLLNICLMLSYSCFPTQVAVRNLSIHKRSSSRRLSF
jgi:hypothetical protein